MTVDKNCKYEGAVLLVFEKVDLVLLLLSVVKGTDWFKLSAIIDFFKAAELRIERVQVVFELTKLPCGIVNDHGSISEI